MRPTDWPIPSDLFAVVERFVENGEAPVRTVIAVGLCEDIQAIMSHRRADERAFEQWLGPRSLAAWRQVDEDMRRVSAALNAAPDGSETAVTGRMLDEVDNPELRKMIETLYWRK